MSVPLGAPPARDPAIRVTDGALSADVSKNLARFCPDALRKAWTSRDALEGQAFWPFAVALEALVADATRFYDDTERYAGFVATVRPRVEATLARRRRRSGLVQPLEILGDATRLS